MSILKTALNLSVILFLTSFAGSAVAEEPAEPIDEGDVPEMVMDSFQKEFPDLFVNEIYKGEINERTYYEFDCTQDDMEFEVMYLADGSLYSTKKEIDIDDLPEEVMSGLSIAFPDGEIEEAKYVTRGSETEYDVVEMVDEADEVVEYDVVLNPDGTILSSRAVESDDDEEDENEEDFGGEDDEED